MRALFYLCLAFATAPAFAASKQEERPLQDLEAHCWSSTVENGSFLCQNLMLMGKMEGKEGWQIPELYAPEGEDKRLTQANLACEKLGFRYALRFETALAQKETMMVRLEASAQYVWQGKGAFIRHLVCE